MKMFNQILSKLTLTEDTANNVLFVVAISIIVGGFVVVLFSGINGIQ